MEKFITLDLQVSKWKRRRNNTNKNQCPYCDKQCGRKNHVLRHIETEHEVHNDIYMCSHCSRFF